MCMREGERERETDFLKRNIVDNYPRNKSMPRVELSCFICISHFKLHSVANIETLRLSIMYSNTKKVLFYAHNMYISSICMNIPSTKLCIHRVYTNLKTKAIIVAIVEGCRVQIIRT